MLWVELAKFWRKSERSSQDMSNGVSSWETGRVDTGVSVVAEEEFLVGVGVG
jgi:hypothetical protein